MSLDLDDYYDDDDGEEVNFKSDGKLKKRAMEKKRSIREAIELREMARELDIPFEDFEYTIH